MLPSLYILRHFTLIRQFSTFLLILLIRTKSSHAYVDGAPARICESMLPSHGEQSMSMDMPFKISLDRHFIQGTGKITITVTSKNSSKFTLKGALFIMKQPKNKFKAFGTFDPKSSEKDLKTVACFGKEGSGITHSHNQPKTMLVFQWNAPNDTNAEYELHATLVRDFNSFWADIIHHQKVRVSVNAPASGDKEKLCLPVLSLTVIVCLIYKHVGI